MNTEQAIAEMKEKNERRNIRAERKEEDGGFNRNRTVRIAETNRMGKIQNLMDPKFKLFLHRCKQYKQQVVHWMVCQVVHCYLLLLFFRNNMINFFSLVV